MTNQLYTIKQVTEIFKEAKPKFVSLKTPSGTFDIRKNQPKTGEVDKRFKAIVDRLNQKSMQPGIYIVAMQNSNMDNTTVSEFPVQVGKESNNKVQMAESITIPQPSVWTMEKAMAVHMDLVETKLQLSYEKQTNAMLTKEIEELESELKKYESLSENGKDNSPFKDAVETIRPLLNIFLEQNDRKLSLQEKQLGLNNNNKPGTTRPDGGIHPTSPGYKEYFEAVMEGDEDDFNYECDYLEKNFPELWKKTAEYYNIEDEPANDTNNE